MTDLILPRRLRARLRIAKAHRAEQDRKKEARIRKDDADRFCANLHREMAESIAQGEIYRDVFARHKTLTIAQEIPKRGLFSWMC